MRSATKVNICVFFLFITSIWMFYFVICYYQMRIGDDLLAPFYMNFQHYVEGSEWKPVDRVSTFKMACRHWIEYYMTFNGRFPVLLQGYIFNKLGECGTAIISSVVYVSTILLICRIGLKSWKTVIKSPVWLLLCSLYMYQLTPTGTYIQMWTFVCQYAVPTLLILLYYLFVLNTYEKNNITLKRSVGILIFGLFVGASHECLAIFAILLVSINIICRGVYKEKNIRRIWINTGLYVGFLITFFAPGNFKRLLSGHDIERYSENIISKLTISMHEHLIAAGVLTRLEIWMIMIFVFAIVLTCKKKGFLAIDFIKNNIELYVVAFFSILIWAVFAPPVPQYGLQLWKACLIIIMLKAIDIGILKQQYWNIIGVVSLTCWVMLNISWVTDLVGVTIARREQITFALESGGNAVFVERYPDTTNNYLTLYNYANQNFDDDCAVAYYGIKIYVEE